MADISRRKKIAKEIQLEEQFENGDNVSELLQNNTSMAWVSPGLSIAQRFKVCEFEANC